MMPFLTVGYFKQVSLTSALPTFYQNVNIAPSGETHWTVYMNTNQSYRTMLPSAILATVAGCFLHHTPRYAVTPLEEEHLRHSLFFNTIIP